MASGHQQLNAIGAAGWELANIVWRPKNGADWRKDWGDALVFCIFKRVANTTHLTSERGWSAASPPAFLSGRRLRYVRRLMRGGAGGKQPNQRSTAQQLAQECQHRALRETVAVKLREGNHAQANVVIPPVSLILRSRPTSGENRHGASRTGKSIPTLTLIGLIKTAATG